MNDLAATQDFYGRWARLYDVLATAPGVRSWRESTADALALSPGDTVVEMGCGTGANFPHLRERVGSEGRVVGVDLTAGMLAQADARVATAGWDNVHLVRGDARRPPIAGPVDAILGTFVVGMFRDPDAVVTDWIDLLADDGSIALLNATRSAHPLAAPLNVAFRGFVRLSTPRRSGDSDRPGGDRSGGDRSGGNRSGSARGLSPTEVLETRIAAGGDAIERETTQSDRRTLAGGFVTLHGGHGPSRN